MHNECPSLVDSWNRGSVVVRFGDAPSTRTDDRALTRLKCHVPNLNSQNNLNACKCFFHVTTSLDLAVFIGY